MRLKVSQLGDDWASSMRASEPTVTPARVASASRVRPRSSRSLRTVDASARSGSRVRHRSDAKRVELLDAPRGERRVHQLARDVDEPSSVEAVDRRVDVDRLAA